jgi:hypothetical protein
MEVPYQEGACITQLGVVHLLWTRTGGSSNASWCCSSSCFRFHSCPVSHVLACIDACTLALVPADVLQTLHVLLHRGGLVPGYTDKPTLLACYVAAMVHDYEHR